MIEGWEWGVGTGDKEKAERGGHTVTVTHGRRLRIALCNIKPVISVSLYKWLRK